MLQTNRPRKTDQALNASMAEWRAQNAKRIEMAVKLLGPKARKDIETALIEIEFEHRKLLGGFKPNKFAKKAIKKFLPSLRRVEMLMRDRNLPYEVRYIDAITIKAVLERCEKIANAPPAKNPRKEAELKRLTIRRAAALMKHSPVKPDDPAFRKAFAALAKALYGKDVDLQCAAYLREARKAK
jgi:hypothetical protein